MKMKSLILPFSCQSQDKNRHYFAILKKLLLSKTAFQKRQFRM